MRHPASDLRGPRSKGSQQRLKALRGSEAPVLPAPRRAGAMLLLAVLLAPLAGAQSLPADPFEPPPPPDLRPWNPLPSGTDEREPTTICTHVMNVGQGPSLLPFFVQLRLDGEVYAETRVEQQMQAGHGTAEPLCWTASLPAGRHQFLVFVDSADEVEELSERNNVHGWDGFDVRPTPQVDLEIVRFWVTPRVGRPDITQTFVAEVANRGDAPSPATVVQFKDENGVIAELPLKALQPGKAARAVHPTFTNLRPVGVFLAQASVDPHGEVPELSELNNAAFYDYEVLEHPAADLVVEDVEVGGNLTALRGVRIRALVPNAGDRPAGAFAVRLLNETNVTLANATLARLGPGENATFEFQILLPVGEHALRVVADALGQVVERSETNNERAFRVAIQPSPVSEDLPNLVVERVEVAPADPRPDEPVTLMAVVRNAGTNRSAATVLNFTVGDRVVASAPVPALEPGRYAYPFATWSGSAEGTYAVRVRADPAGAVRELDESDNHLAHAFQVLVPPPPPPTPEAPPGIRDPPGGVTPPPTPTTPTSPTPGGAEGVEAVELSDISIGTRPVPGGVKGVVIAALRNPTLEPVGRLTVTFKVDGKPLAEVLVDGLGAAATGSARTSEVDLPAGEHVVTVEVRAVGSGAPLAKADRTYTAEAGEKGVPAPGAALVAAVAVVAALARRRAR